MKVKVIASNPVDCQDSIENLIGQTFETVSYNEFDTDTRKEMKELGEVAIRTSESIKDQYILNKNEYEIVG